MVRPTLARMAAHHHKTVHMDPALVKYANMNAERYKYFRWTPRTAWISLIYIGIVPGFLLWAAYRTEGKWDLRGKMRGDIISEW